MTALEKTEELIGCAEFKRTMRELSSIIPEVMERGIPDTLFYQNYIFSIDKGCGLSTCLSYMADMLREAGIGDVPVEEAPAPSELKEYPAASLFPRKGRYLIKCIDIGEWINRTGHPEFTKYLEGLQRKADTTIYVFRVPVLPREVLRRIRDDLSDILYVKSVEFEPARDGEMRAFAARVAEEMGFTLDDGALGQFLKKIDSEKQDGRFYGFNTARKVIQEIVFSKLVSNAEGRRRVSVIDSSDVSGTMQSKIAKSSWRDVMTSLVGLEKVKRQISEITEQIKFMRSEGKGEMPCIHMRFVGNPGTGKTTVARIVGEALRECGVLRNGGFYEYSGRSFIGRYIGETARRTAEICRAAYGSVLFIDEAYSLFFSENDDRDFGREALSTLISEMENHRGDTVVIMAGYTDEMETLMKGNRGLESRMPYLVEFDNYSRDELCAIFMKMAAENAEFCVEDGLYEAVLSYLAEIPDSYLNGKSFANARFVRNLYERTLKKALSRHISQISPAKDAPLTISVGDFLSAAAEKEFASLTETGRTTVGF